MNTEPTPEVQAMLKLKLEDGVKELIRKEMQNAFKDHNFLKEMFFSGNDTFLKEILLALNDHSLYSAITSIQINNSMDESMAKKMINNERRELTAYFYTAREVYMKKMNDAADTKP